MQQAFSWIAGGFGDLCSDFLCDERLGGSQEKVLHSFGRGTDGYLLNAGLIFDAAGNLYGTTVTGGIHSCGDLGCGTVFEIVP